MGCIWGAGDLEGRTLLSAWWMVWKGDLGVWRGGRDEGRKTQVLGLPQPCSAPAGRV